MRTIDLNGYIDDEVWFGDEITPEMLHDRLYESEDREVLIRLHSYGGLCTSAVRMYDMIRDYPGTVDVIISGVAASAATVLASGGRTVRMTPGSLYMIHNPLVLAYGNEQSLMEAVQLLQACKDSILNIYELRSTLDRQTLSDLMTATAWFDAKAALERGFVDGIAGAAENGARGGERAVNRADAEQKVQAWMDRRNPAKAFRPAPGEDHTSAVTLPEKGERPKAQDGTPREPGEPGEEAPQGETGAPIAQLEKRLGLLLPKR